MRRPQMADRLLSADDAAELLGVRPSTEDQPASEQSF